MKLPICFWCRQLRTDARALLGSARDRDFDPVVVNYTPCPDCKKYLELRIFCYEVRPRDEFDDGRPGLGGVYEDLAPTGRWAAIRPDRLQYLPIAKERIDDIAKQKLAQFDKTSFEFVFAAHLELLKQPFERVEVASEA